MDITQLVVRLIRQYADEQNHLARARRAKRKIHHYSYFKNEMQLRGLLNRLPSADLKKKNWLYRSVRGSFLDFAGVPTYAYFVNYAIKRNKIKRAQSMLDNAIDAKRPTSVTSSQEQTVLAYQTNLKKLQDTPVLWKLGKKWQALIDAHIDEERAYKARWEARCAIKGFNKLDLGMKIKFGNCNPGSCGFNHVQSVNVDGYDVPVKKFLENAQFEQAILAA